MCHMPRSMCPNVITLNALQVAQAEPADLDRVKGSFFLFYFEAETRSAYVAYSCYWSLPSVFVQTTQLCPHDTIYS